MSVLARRYAAALRETAGPSESSKVLDDLEMVEGAFRTVPDLKKVLENPGIALPEKQSLLMSLQDKAGLMPVVIRFLVLLTERRRVTLLHDAVAAFRSILDAEAGLVRGHLTTAKPLKGAQVSSLSERLAAALGHPVILDARVREDLIAGAQLQVGSTVYDGSVSGALKALKSSLVKGSA